MRRAPLTPLSSLHVLCAPAAAPPQVFPHIAADNQLFAYTLNGYWMDVGQPKDYLKGGQRKTCTLNGYWMDVGQPKDCLKGGQRKTCTLNGYWMDVGQPKD